MPVTETWINPDVLRWARERLNLTPRQVAEESKKLAKQHFAALSAVELQAVDGALVDKILAAKRADPLADVTALEREIDQHVYRLYGLTAEEIKIVEEGAG
jgi:hypothetical protein